MASKLELMAGAAPGGQVTISSADQRAGVLVVTLDTTTGEMVASTDPTGQAEQLLAAAPSIGGMATADLGSFLLTEGSSRMRLGLAAPPPGSTAATAVAVSLDPADRLGRSLMLSLVLVGVGLVGFYGAVVAWVRWRALRPVEALRDQVAALATDSGRHRLSERSGGGEVDRLVRTMNQLLARLDRANERQRQFVADASHELRSPLAAICTQLEVAIEHPGAIEWPAVAPGLMAETQRVGRLVDDLLLLASAGDAARIGSRVALVDLDDLVLAQVKAVHWPESVWVDLSHVSAGLVGGNADQLSRLVRNLLDNAARHAVRNVTVSVQEERADVVLVVADDGGGIPADRREIVFERFVRLDEGRARHQGGTGLGLAIVREVARAHGGEVTVDDAEPGARFTVRLPRARHVHYAEVE
ncbi:MAG: HAMP domain-containing sensor histidine kinase [Acidimicrobiales bacterium]